MQRFSFSLPLASDRQQFKAAIGLLRKAQADGWRLTAAETGYSGGLPAGQFVIALADERETIPFRLGEAALASYRDAVRQTIALPPDHGILVAAEMKGSGANASGVLVVGPAVAPQRAAPPSASRTRAAKSAVRSGLLKSSEQVKSAYDLTEEAALKALREGKGEQAEQVKALLGDDYFELLSGMARQAAAKSGTRARDLGKVLVLPGIMGSKLGTRKSFFGLNYSDVIWLDPVDMRLGRLADLTLTPEGKAQNGTQCVGILYSFYLRLKLTLDLAGFDANFHPYDWRRPIRDLGAEFAAFLNAQPEPVTIVAHSMGGIVTRAAIKAGARDDKVKRLIMVGTPNHGSFVPAQAFRAAYPFLKTLAVTFDRDLVTVTDEVFSSFAGLYDLLAAPEKFSNFPLFDAGKWPPSRPRPNRDLLKSAKIAQSLLAPADERFHLICGVNQDTIVDVKVDDDEFVFLQNKDGDGTVPRISAELPDCPTLYVDGSHGMLPNYKIVCDLAVDLATSGRTDRKTMIWTPPIGPLEEVRESKLRAVEIPRGLTRGAEPSPEALRSILKPILALPPLAESAPAPALPPSPESVPAVVGASAAAVGALFSHELQGVVVGRHRQRQLEVALFPGSLTAVPTRAYLLGLFQGVAPAGAARAVDQLMEGVVSDFVQRRMLSGRLGEVFILPKGRSFVLADHVIFVGLGPFDRFRDAPIDGGQDTMRLVCESVVRTCLHANIEEFATILLGGSATLHTGDAVRIFTRSFLDALKVADPNRRLRKVTLCENDPQRVTEIKTELLRLATTDMFEDVELELRDLPERVIEAPKVPSRASAPARPNPIYLLTRMFDPTIEEGGAPRPGLRPGDSRGDLQLETSFLLPQSKAAVKTFPRSVSASAKRQLLAQIGRGGFSTKTLEQIGHDLVAFAFGDSARDDLRLMAKEFRDRPLVIVHDAIASQLPWEALRIDDWRPAIEGGVYRQHLEANLSVAKWLEERAMTSDLDVLLVTNPTGDLEGAEAEGAMVRDLLSKIARIRLTERRGEQATRAQLLTDFRTGRFDVVHYAGHAFFSPDLPGRSGLLCANEEVLSGVDVAGLSNLPSLVFFNACEAGRIRGGKGPGATPAPPARRVDLADNLSFAAALIRGGVANFLGTYWPVGDLPAATFSETFYRLLVDGTTLGDAVLAARRAVEKKGSADWADYILYGNPEFVLKRRGS